MRGAVPVLMGGRRIGTLWPVDRNQIAAAAGGGLLLSPTVDADGMLVEVVLVPLEKAPLSYRPEDLVVVDGQVRHDLGVGRGAPRNG